MISVDDVTLTAQLDEPVRGLRSLTPGQPVACRQRTGQGGRQFLWRYTWRPGLVVHWCQVLNTVEYKISVPRLWGATANFPLPEYESIRGWPLDDVCEDILWCLGLDGLLDQHDPITALGLCDAGVRRIAYAMDYLCEDIPGTINAVGMGRRRRKRPDRFDEHSLQWTLADHGYRVQMYDKAKQLRGDKWYTKEDRKSLSEDAADTLRVEVTLGSPLHIRKVLGIDTGGVLPTLDLMASPLVAAKLFRLELYDRLGVHRLRVREDEFFEGLRGTFPTVEQLEDLDELGRAMALAAAVIAGFAREYRSATDSTDKAGKTSQQILVAFLEMAGMGEDAIMRTLNMSTRQLADRRRELKDFGPADLYSRVLVRGLLDAFRSQCPDEDHKWTLDLAELAEYLVPAPWAPDDEFDVGDDGEETVVKNAIDDWFDELVAMYGDDVDLDDDYIGEVA